MGARVRYLGTGDIRVKNSVKIEVPKELREHLTLKYMVNEILFGALGVRRDDIFCFQERKVGYFVVTFTTMSICNNFYEKVKRSSDNEKLDELEDIPLVVCMFNYFVTRDVIY